MGVGAMRGWRLKARRSAYCGLHLLWCCMRCGAPHAAAQRVATLFRPSKTRRRARRAAKARAQPVTKSVTFYCLQEAVTRALPPRPASDTAAPAPSLLQPARALTLESGPESGRVCAELVQC